MKNPKKKNLKEKRVEILDNAGQPFMLMNLDLSIKKKLTRKIVLVAIKNQENQILLTKVAKSNKHKYSGLWDISVYSHVYENEACEDAALRGLKDKLGIEHTSLYEIASLPYIGGDGIPSLAFVFTTSKLSAQEKITLLSQGKNDTMFVSISELKAILEHSAELFTPELIWALQAGWLS